MAFINNKRRQFLRSAGGYMLAIPFLPSLAERAFAADPVIPKRFISVRSLYGQPPELFYPSSYRPTTKITVPGSANNYIYHRAFQNNELISDIIGENFRSVATKLSILRGLDVTTSEHNVCLMLAPGKYIPPGDTISSWKTSLDEVLAASSVMYPTTPQYRILRLEPAPFSEGGYGYSLINGQAQAYEKDMNKLFTSLFKNNANGAGTSDPANTKKLKAVDLTLGAYNYLKNSRQISSVDKTRLDQFYSILSDTENKLKSVQQYSCTPGTNYAAPTYDLAYDLANDIIMLALSCGLTQVVSLSLFYFSALAGENGTSFHGKSHWTFGGTSNYPNIGAGNEAKINGLSDADIGDKATYLNTLKRMWSLSSNKVGSLMTKMNNIVEANGKTMLDNSLVYWGNETGGAASHGNRSSMPVVVGGTLGGLVTPGYWDYTHRPFLRNAGNGFFDVVGTIPYPNFLTTLCNLYGLPTSSYERAGQGGFGDFELTWDSNYAYEGNGVSKDGATIFAEYLTTAGRRKNLPGWFKA